MFLGNRAKRRSGKIVAPAQVEAHLLRTAVSYMILRKPYTSYGTQRGFACEEDQAKAVNKPGELKPYLSKRESKVQGEEAIAPGNRREAYQGLCVLMGLPHSKINQVCFLHILS